MTNCCSIGLSSNLSKQKPKSSYADGQRLDFIAIRGRCSKRPRRNKIFLNDVTMIGCNDCSCQDTVPSGTHQSHMESHLGLISPGTIGRINLTMASLRDGFPFWVDYHEAYELHIIIPSWFAFCYTFICSQSCASPIHSCGQLVHECVSRPSLFVVVGLPR